jgi:hypothetical protein
VRRLLLLTSLDRRLWHCQAGLVLRSQVLFRRHKRRVLALDASVSTFALFANHPGKLILAQKTSHSRETYIGKSLSSCVLTTSFGIVMWEIVSRTLPYSEETDTGPNGRFLRLKIASGLRPRLEAILLRLHNDVYVGLMQQCWSADPEARPDFVRICFQLEKLVREIEARDHFA